MKELFKISFINDSLPETFKSPTVVIGFSWATIITVLAIGMAFLIYMYFLRKHFFKGLSVVPVKVTFGKDFKVECEIERNEENIFISHRIYIELVTRKAAMEVDPEHDVISDIYDSWYKLFGIVRDEIKNVPGRSLLDNRSTSDLTKLTIEILNKGLRPHLTTYQAEFRRWYKQALELDENKGLPPQKIQEKYSKLGELVADIKKVNGILMDYANQLKIIFTQPKK